MKSKALALLVFGNLVLPIQLYAQEHARYRLIDVGTLGGPSAYASVNAPGYQILNNAGVVGFGADTPMTDPNAPNLCFNLDCFVSHAIRWQKGVPTDIGALPGTGNGSLSGAINAGGWITGQSQNGEIDPLTGIPEVRATLWTDDKIIDLGTFGGNFSLGITLNNRGEVVGFATNNIPDPFGMFLGAQTRAFLWRDGELLDLGTLGGPDAQSLSINQRGQVVGEAYTDSTPNNTTGIPTTHPFLWEHGKMLDLGTLGGTYAGAGSCAFGVAICNTPVQPPFEGSLLINDRGQVTGTSNLAGDQIFHPFLWEKGTMKDLGTLGGDNGVAIWLTNNGEVVGDADLPDNPPNCIGLACIHHAFLWKDGTMTDLGTLGADPCSRAVMMNSKGQIVGSTISICGQAETNAFLWENGGPMVALDALIPANSGAHLLEGENINERGEILALGLLNDGCGDPHFCGHLFLLIPCESSNAVSCTNRGAADAR